MLMLVTEVLGLFWVGEETFHKRIDDGWKPPVAEDLCDWIFASAWLARHQNTPNDLVC